MTYNDRDHRDQAKLLDDTRSAALETVVQQLRLVHELKQGTTATPPSLATGKGAEEFLFDFARLSVNNYNEFLKLSSKYFPDIADVLRVAGSRPTQPAPALQRIDLPEVSGQAGKQVTTAEFCVENPYDVDLSLSFTNPPFQRQAQEGGAHDEAFCTEITFKDKSGSYRPGAKLTLPKGTKERFLRAHIDLNHPKFSATSKSTNKFIGECRILSTGRTVGILRITLNVTTR